MKYIVCEQLGTFRLKEKGELKKERGKAILQVKKVGVCGTDLHAYQGNQAFFTYPRILGHELSTEVLQIEENTKGIQVGDKVVVMPYISCGNCIACRNGKTNCCTNIEVLGVHTDGGMQEQISVPLDLLIPVKKLTDAEMAIVEPLAIGAHAIRRAKLKRGETVVVVGCGPIGIGIMKLAQLSGVTTIAVDIDKERLGIVKDVFGVEHTIIAGERALEAVSAITNGEMATVVFDATGHRGALESGLDFMAHGGAYVLVGLSKGDLTFDHPKIHAKESSILCSRNATLEDFETVIDILENGEFPADSFITHEVNFTEMVNHFDKWLDPANGVIKAIINF